MRASASPPTSPSSSCFCLALKLELPQSSGEAVRTLPDKEITPFQLDQLTEVAHHTTTQPVRPAQGENTWLEARKGGCDHSRAMTFTEACTAEVTTNEALLCKYKIK